MSNWDQYFMEIAEVVSKRTKCLSRKIGAVIVRDKSIVSTGYNGPPRGVPHCSERYSFMLDKKLMKEINKIDGMCPKVFKKYVDKKVCPRQILGFKSGEGLEWCIAGHAERNAIVNAARLGVSVKDTTMYMTCGIPCTPCLVEIINSGIIELVVTKKEYYDATSEYLVNNSSLKIRLYGEKNETEA